MSFAVLDGDFPNVDARDEDIVFWVTDEGSSFLGQLLVVGCPPNQDVGVQQNVHTSPSGKIVDASKSAAISLSASKNS